VADFVPLQTLYTRALGLLGVQGAGSRQTALALSVQPVSILSDVSDASIPHSNPVFGVVASQPAVAANNSQITVFTARRMLKLRQINVIAGTQVVLGVTAVDPLTTVVATVAQAAVGRVGPAAAEPTAITRAGRSLAAALPANSWLPVQGLVDMRPPILIAPGQFLTFEDQVQNTTVTLSCLWEEIPEQTDSADLGFPV